MIRYLIPLLFAFQLNFQTFDRVRAVDGNDILSDVLSHNYNDNYKVSAKDYTNYIPSQDSMLISSTHECTHGVNSILRDRLSTKENKVNAFYCLDNRYVSIKESRLTLSDVAKKIPNSIRFTSYELIFSGVILRDWNDRCLYLCDDWISHSHGAMYRKQKNIKEREGALKFAFEYGMYSLVHLQMLKGTDYEDYDKLKWFHEWNFNRCFDTFNNERDLIDNIKIFITSKDCEALRLFIAQEFGQEFYERFYKIGNMD